LLLYFPGFLTPDFSLAIPLVDGLETKIKIEKATRDWRGEFHFYSEVF
jgi:hypothetical protein